MFRRPQFCDPAAAWIEYYKIADSFGIEPVSHKSIIGGRNHNRELILAIQLCARSLDQSHILFNHVTAFGGTDLFGQKIVTGAFAKLISCKSYPAFCAAQFGHQSGL